METARDRLARHYPRKGATPAQIKAWVAACQAVATPEERAEYEQTGRDIGALFRRIGVDPLTQQSHQREFKVSV
jgi:hypothetical protein